MKDLLYQIKQELFDAPTEIKRDFNKLVEFFDVHEWSYLMIEYFRPDVIKDIQMQIEPEDLYTKGDKGLEEFTHVTVAPKLENNLDIEKLKSCLKDISEYSGIIEETSVFELPEYDVLKCDVRCDNLNLANKIIKTLFTLHTEFTEYQPHMTIAYLQKGKGKEYIQKFTSTEIKPRRFALSNGGSKEVAYFDNEELQLEKFEEELDELLAKYLKSQDTEFKKDVLRTMGAKIVDRNKSALLTRTCRSIGNAIAYACKSGPSNSVQVYWNSMM